MLRIWWEGPYAYDLNFVSGSSPPDKWLIVFMIFIVLFGLGVLVDMLRVL